MDSADILTVLDCRDEKTFFISRLHNSDLHLDSGSTIWLHSESGKLTKYIIVERRLILYSNGNRELMLLVEEVTKGSDE